MGPLRWFKMICLVSVYRRHKLQRTAQDFLVLDSNMLRVAGSGPGGSADLKPWFAWCRVGSNFSGL